MKNKSGYSAAEGNIAEKYNHQIPSFAAIPHIFRGKINNAMLFLPIIIPQNCHIFPCLVRINIRNGPGIIFTALYKASFSSPLHSVLAAPSFYLSSYHSSIPSVAARIPPQPRELRFFVPVVFRNTVAFFLFCTVLFSRSGNTVHCHRCRHF